jgi:hypothetical protein
MPTISILLYDVTSLLHRRPWRQGKIRLACYVAVVLVSLLGNVGPPTSAQAIPLTIDSRLEVESINDSTLVSLIQIGWHNKVPFGIVTEGDTLCTHKPAISTGEMTIAHLIAEVNANIPGYVAELSDGVLLIHPIKISPDTDRALHLVIHNFSSAPTTLQELGIGLWMYMRAELVPGQTSAFTGGVQRDAELLPSINVPETTVESLLNLLISKKSGGVWVMNQVDGEWLRNPKTIPYEIFSYSGDAQAVKSIRCSH